MKNYGICCKCKGDNMKKVPYDGDISKDLANINKEFDYKKGLKTNIIVTVLLAVGLINIGFAANFSLEFFITYILTLIYSFSCGLNVIHKNKKYFKKQQEKSLNNIKELKYNLSKEDIDLSLEDLKDYIKEEICISEKILDNKDNLYQNLEKVISKFYMLDNDSKLQVLKSVREVFNYEEIYKLYLLEDEDKQIEKKVDEFVRQRNRK